MLAELADGCVATEIWQREKIQFLRICVSDKKIGILKKLRWDISDTGNRIIVILEDLTTIQKIS